MTVCLADGLTDDTHAYRGSVLGIAVLYTPEMRVVFAAGGSFAHFAAHFDFCGLLWGHALGYPGCLVRARRVWFLPGVRGEVIAGGWSAGCSSVMAGIWVDPCTTLGRDVERRTVILTHTLKDLVYERMQGIGARDTDGNDGGPAPMRVLCALRERDGAELPADVCVLNLNEAADGAVVEVRMARSHRALQFATVQALAVAADQCWCAALLSSGRVAVWSLETGELCSLHSAACTDEDQEDLAPKAGGKKETPRTGTLCAHDRAPLLVCTTGGDELHVYQPGVVSPAAENDEEGEEEEAAAAARVTSPTRVASPGSAPPPQ